MSRSLLACDIDHVVLERGRVAEKWRSERWDSLRLLTPNWQTRLPGWSYRGPDPEGYMTAAETAAYLAAYAASFAAPILTGTAVRRLAPDGTGYRVTTSRGTWWTQQVVIATGAANTASVPAISAGLPRRIHQLVATRYRSPARIPPGKVLIVGASASGTQIAAELRTAGREVVLSTGKHVRVPRRYRGRDIMWWLEACGFLGERSTDVRDLERARRQPSFQLAGTRDGSNLDLAVLQELGVRVVGRVRAFDGERAALADDLEASVAAAGARLERLLARIDSFIEASALRVPDPAPIAPVRAPAAPTALDLRAEGIGTVIWATGYVRRYPWLTVPVGDACGEIPHDQGITRAPGLYVLGQPLQRTRKSTFIDGVGDDARVLARRIAAHLHRAAHGSAKGWRP